MASPGIQEQRIDLFGTVQVLHEYLTASLCQTAFQQTRTRRGDTHCSRGARQGAVLRDMSRHGHQRAAAHSGMEAQLVGRVLLSDPEAPVGHAGLSDAE